MPPVLPSFVDRLPPCFLPPAIHILPPKYRLFSRARTRQREPEITGPSGTGVPASQICVSAGLYGDVWQEGSWLDNHTGNVPKVPAGSGPDVQDWQSGTEAKGHSLRGGNR
jgi:hypothetical protein